VLKLKYVSSTTKRMADGSSVVFYYYRRPKQPSVALGSDPIVARERHRILEMQYAAASTAAVRQAGTVGELIQTYYASSEWMKTSDATKALWRISFRDLESNFGNFPPAAITRKVAHALKEKLIKSRRGPSAIRNRIVPYRRLWNWATKQAGHLSGENPWTTLGSFGEPIKQRPGRLWEDEHVNAFLSASRRVKIGGNPQFTDPNEEKVISTPDYMRLALLLGLTTTQRLGDVLTLTGRNLSERDGHFWLTLRQSKTGAEVSFPLLSIAEAEMRAQGVEPGDDSFLIKTKNGLPFDTRSFAKRFRVWTTAAKLKHTYKDLRSSGMVWLSRAGADATQIVSISGHAIGATQKILDTYIKRNEKSAEIAVGLLEAAIQRDAEARVLPAKPHPMKGPSRKKAKQSRA
jgi:hypothetical protein